MFPGLSTHQLGKCLPPVELKQELPPLCPDCHGNGVQPQEKALAVHEWCPTCGGKGRIIKGAPLPLPKETPWKTQDGSVSHYWVTLPNGKEVSACGLMSKGGLLPEDGDRCTDCEYRSADG